MEGTPITNLESLKKAASTPPKPVVTRSPAAIFSNQKAVVNNLASGMSHALAPKIDAKNPDVGLGSLLEKTQSAFDDRQASIDNLNGLIQQQQNQMYDPGLSTVDLTPLMAFVDNFTGSKLASTYKPPQSQKDKLGQLQLLEKLKQKQEQELADDQLKFAKIASDASGESPQSIRDKLRALALARQNQAFDYNILKTEGATFKGQAKDYLENLNLSAQMLQALENPNNNVALQAAVKSLASINQGGRLSDFDVKSALNSPGIQQSLEKWLDAKINNKPITDIQFDQIKEYAAKLGKFSYDSIKDLEDGRVQAVQSTPLDPDQLKNYLQADKLIKATRFPELVHKVAPEFAVDIPDYSQPPSAQAKPSAPPQQQVAVPSKPQAKPVASSAKPMQAVDAQKIKEENLRKFREQKAKLSGKKP